MKYGEPTKKYALRIHLELPWTNKDTHYNVTPLHLLHLARSRHSSRRWPEQILRDVEESQLQQIAQALNASTSLKEKHVIFRNSGFFMWQKPHAVGFVRFCHSTVAHSTLGKNPFSQPCCVADGSAAIGGFEGEASEEPSEPRSRGLRRTESLIERIFFDVWHFVWHFVFCHSIHVLYGLISLIFDVDLMPRFAKELSQKKTTFKLCSQLFPAVWS